MRLAGYIKESSHNVQPPPRASTGNAEYFIYHYIVWRSFTFQRLLSHISLHIGSYDYAYERSYELQTRLWNIYCFLLIAGCKIKALRAKTNTYIKTPVRGEEPVFVVTGRKEDVAKAKREILSAAEHFSLIRASRKPSLLGGLTGKGTPPGPPTNIPGQITILVRVPYRVGEYWRRRTLRQLL